MNKRNPQVSVILFARASKQFKIQTRNYQKENYVLNSGGSRQSDKDGAGRGRSRKKCFGPVGPLFGFKLRGGPPLDPPLLKQHDQVIHRPPGTQNTNRCRFGSVIHMLFTSKQKLSLKKLTAPYKNCQEL